MQPENLLTESSVCSRLLTHMPRWDIHLAISSARRDIGGTLSERVVLSSRRRSYHTVLIVPPVQVCQISCDILAERRELQICLTKFKEDATIPTHRNLCVSI